jgi:hypothetical protein
MVIRYEVRRVLPVSVPGEKISIIGNGLRNGWPKSGGERVPEGEA